MCWPPSYDHVFRLLERVRRAGKGWKACCPSHDDRHPSLGVGFLRNGSGLGVHCHAGRCRFRDILAALESRAGHPVWLYPYGERPGRRPGPHRSLPVTVTATYDYCDEGGEVLFQVVRTAPKGFYQRRPNPDYRRELCPPEEEWLNGLGDARRVLYRLPDLAEAEGLRMILCVEGERDCETARSLGVIATTNAGGAGKFYLSDYQALRGAHVCVVPDVDAPDPRTMRSPGMEHALQVVNCLYGLAAEVRLLRLPGPPGTDFTSWVQAFRPGTDAAVIRQALAAMVRNSPQWTPWGPEVTPPPDAGPFLADVLGRADALAARETRLFSVPDAAGAVEVAAAALSRLADTARPPPGAVRARLAGVAAECVRAARDLGLSPPAGPPETGKPPQTGGRP